jgi:beta-N-acetylhexosaminidase
MVCCKAGMANCGKHFPGHGFVRADSHTDIPRGPAQPQGHPGRRRCALWLAAHHAYSVMPAHVIYPAVDSTPGGLFQPLAAGHPARALGFGAPSSATT